MKIAAEFVTSAATIADFPRTGIPEVVLVGRSNVGKSSLINALVRQRVARTSAAPGKTRLANFYQVERGSVGPMYFVDLPGYGYAPGAGAARDFDEITRGVFGSVGLVSHARPTLRGALLLVDARHPGLDKDRQAWAWLHDATPNGAVVATKIDKLARGERIRALRELESVFDDPVMPVSAVTGEGLDELWKLIDKLAHPRNPKPRSRNLPVETARSPHPRR